MTTDNLSKYLSSLKPKHASFVRFYTDKASDTFDNATQSYIKAGYAKKGANASSHLLLTKPAIQQAIQNIRDEYAKTENWSTFDDWYNAGLKCFNELDSKSANRLGFWQSLGKAKGYLGADNQINTLLIGADDLAKLRQSIQSRLQGTATQSIASANDATNSSQLLPSCTTNSIDGGDGVTGRTPPATPLYRDTTPLQSAHNFTPSSENIDVTQSDTKTYGSEPSIVTTDCSQNLKEDASGDK